VDERGIHRFDPAEVEEIAKRDSEHLGRLDAPPAVVEREALVAVEARIGSLNLRLRAADSELQRSVERVRQAERRGDEFRSTAIQALEIVAAVLGPETPDAVHAAIRRLERR